MWTVEFFISRTGRRPVADFIKRELSKEETAQLQERLKLLQEYGPDLSKEYPRAMTRLTGRYRDVYEIRIANSSQVRVFFIFEGNRAVLVHGTKKAGKGKKKMKQQYETALTRSKEHQRGKGTR